MQLRKELIATAAVNKEIKEPLLRSRTRARCKARRGISFRNTCNRNGSFTRLIQPAESLSNGLNICRLDKNLVELCKIAKVVVSTSIYLRYLK